MREVSVITLHLLLMCFRNGNAFTSIVRHLPTLSHCDLTTTPPSRIVISETRLCQSLNPDEGLLSNLGMSEPFNEDRVVREHPAAIIFSFFFVSHCIV
jgi:hypothetical protein